MRAKWYAQALYELMKDNTESAGTKILKNFVGTLERNGHAILLPSIVRSLKHIEKHEAAKETILVSSAEMLSEGEVSKMLKSEPFKQMLLPTHKRVVRHTDPTLIGGAVVRTHEARLDASYKRGLLNLYEKITSN